MTLPALTVGAVVKLSPDPNFPKAVYSDTEWEVLAVYKNNSGFWSVGQVTKGSDVGSQTPLDTPERYELVTPPKAN